jgi:large subunit ribosomal protein L6
MSRIGKSEIKIPSGVTLKIEGQNIEVKGPKGTLSHSVHKKIAFEVNDNILTFTCSSEEPAVRALHGTSRAVVANLVKGVTEGFSKTLEIVGVGYRGEPKGKGVNFLLGFSHPVLVEPPEGISLKMEGTNKCTISGIDKQKVGQIAAEIRAFRPPEPYKGKGVRYIDEYIRRKEVKKS